MLPLPLSREAHRHVFVQAEQLAADRAVEWRKPFFEDIPPAELPYSAAILKALSESESAVRNSDMWHLYASSAPSFLNFTNK